MRQTEIKVTIKNDAGDGVRLRKPLMLVLLVVLLAGSWMFAQYSYYYGKNKVTKHSYDWKYIETDHYRIHYYTNDEKLVKKVARAAETAYTKISDYLNVRLEKKVPLIFYTTHIDFELNNIAGYMPPSAVAFAESTQYRVVIQGEMSFDELDRTITHEMGHIFEYEVMGNRARFISPPLWLVEGFSEFMAETWDPFNSLAVRDRVLTGRIPLLNKNGELETPYYNSRLIPYDFGHLIYEFLDQKYGRRGIKKLLYSLKGGSLFRAQQNVMRVFDMSPKLFNHEFGKFLRSRYKKFLGREDPEDYSYIIGPDFPYAYSLSHQVSPSGEMLAVLTVNQKQGDIDIILVSMKDGKVIKNITPGFTSRYDVINLNFVPTDGISISWNRKDNQLAFFARRAWDDYLVVVDVLSGKILEQIKIDTIQAPSSPVFHPGGQKIYFTGQEHTKSYIYAMNLQDKKVVKLTEGLLFIKSINLSPDGQRIVFSASTPGTPYHKLYLGTIDKPGMAKKLTDGDYNDITPFFSEDGRYIYYSCDELESYNIYALDLEEQVRYRYSDVMTGNFFPIPIPGEKGQVVMSSYYKGMFQLFKLDVSTPREKTALKFAAVDTETLARQETEMKIDVNIKEQGKYKPLKRLFLQSLPPLAVSIGTDGSLWGYSSVTMTDLLGDHNFTFYVSSFYGYRSYHLMYLNQEKRLQLYGHLFSYSDVYYFGTGGGLKYSRNVRKMYGGEIGVFYPFNREYRAEARLSLYRQEENLDKIYLGHELPYGQYYNGTVLPLRLSLVGETTMFSNYGPNNGHTFNITFEKYIKLGSGFMDTYTIEADLRKYIRLDNSTLLAFRLVGFHSGGDNPVMYWTGGNNSIRSIGFRSWSGTNMFVFNSEFRFALVHMAYTPIGIIGPVRGVLFFDMGGAWFKGQKFRIFDEDEFRLKNAIASYGFGLEFFMFGYPMHVEWVWRTDLRKRDYYGVNFWIGFDF